MAANGTSGSGGPRYVLLTQCLQNDFFLNRECRLFLPDFAVKTMLLGKRAYDRDLGTGSRRTIGKTELDAGPLARFLDLAIGRRRRGEETNGTLDVINIRDWHVTNDAYDAERRRYGAHCERGSWGAQYVDGLTKYLDPGEGRDGEESVYFEEGTVRIHHVHADSLFDFRPRSENIGTNERKFQKSALEVLLDVILQGSQDDVAKMCTRLREHGRPAALFELSREIDLDETVRCRDKAYVAVIGVYTDLKVQMLLSSLRTYYNLPNLAVSDTFTASATLERHLAGLDFAAKVLDVEVIHGINDLVGFLGGSAEVENENEIVAADNFARYQSFFQDRQNVLAYESQRLQEYLMLTERRSLAVYNAVRRANTFLLVWGGVFLTATLVLSIAAAFGAVNWQLAVATGGLSLVQFVGAFFTQPASDLQRNLTNLATFKMILESHSLKTALARFHLTTPLMLRELQSEREATAAGRQVDTLHAQLAVIQSLDHSDFASLRDVGFRFEPGPDGAPAVPPAASAENGAPAPAPAETAASE